MLGIARHTVELAAKYVVRRSILPLREMKGGKLGVDMEICGEQDRINSQPDTRYDRMARWTWPLGPVDRTHEGGVRCLEVGADGVLLR